MSIISNIHTAQVYDPKTTKPFEGQRLVVTIAKKDKDGNYGPHLQQTQATSIPQLAMTQDDFALASVRDVATEYFKSVQNQIISDNIKSGKKEIRDSDLSISAIVDYLNSESAGDKWTTERIGQWFNDNLAIPFTEKLIENGIDDSEINKKLIITSKRFADTLASKARVPTMVAEKLTQVLELMGDSDDSVYKKFYAKLNPPALIDALDFGF